MTADEMKEKIAHTVVLKEFNSARWIMTESIGAFDSATFEKMYEAALQARAAIRAYYENDLDVFTVEAGLPEVPRELLILIVSYTH